jgi:hypothetical protein
MSQISERASRARLRSSAANLTGPNILLVLLAQSQATLMTPRSSHACLTAAEIAVIFQPFDGWVRSTAGSTLFPRGGGSRGRMFAGQKR